jgi:hypothetical protein
MHLTPENVRLFDSDENSLECQMEQRGAELTVRHAPSKPGTYTLGVYDNDANSLGFLSAQAYEEEDDVTVLNSLNQLLGRVFIIQAQGTVMGRPGSLRTRLLPSSSESFQGSYENKLSVWDDVGRSESRPDTSSHMGLVLSVCGPDGAKVPTMRESSELHRFTTRQINKTNETN